MSLAFVGGGGGDSKKSSNTESVLIWWRRHGSKLVEMWTRLRSWQNGLPDSWLANLRLSDRRRGWLLALHAVRTISALLRLLAHRRNISQEDSQITAMWRHGIWAVPWLWRYLAHVAAPIWNRQGIFCSSWNSLKQLWFQNLIIIREYAGPVYIRNPNLLIIFLADVPAPNGARPPARRHSGDWNVRHAFLQRFLWLSMIPWQFHRPIMPSKWWPNSREISPHWECYFTHVYIHVCVNNGFDANEM